VFTFALQVKSLVADTAVAAGSAIGAVTKDVADILSASAPNDYEEADMRK
jgi:hypothetical protein